MQELNEYQNKGLIWYGCNSRVELERLSTSFSELDEVLQGGFPSQGVIELKTQFGIGELRLLTPYITQKQQQGEIVFIAPPIQLNAEFFVANNIDLSRLLLITNQKKDLGLWAAEQCLSSGCCSLVVIWQAQLSIKQMRRMMLACEQGGATLVVIRYQQPAQIFFSLPSALSLTLKPHPKGLEVKVDKQKGGRASEFFLVDMGQYWPELSEHRKRRSEVKENNVVSFPTAIAQ